MMWVKYVSEVCGSMLVMVELKQLDVTALQLTYIMRLAGCLIASWRHPKM